MRKYDFKLVGYRFDAEPVTTGYKINDRDDAIALARYEVKDARRFPEVHVYTHADEKVFQIYRGPSGMVSEYTH